MHPSCQTLGPMQVIRSFASLLLAAVAALAILFATTALRSTWSIDATIAHNREVEAAFGQAVEYVNTFRKNNGRLPSAAEFKTWNSTYPSRPYTPNGMWLEVAPFQAQAIERFGRPSGDAYLLVYWMGEWEEFYASWVGRSSLNFDPAAYSILGSNFADGTAAIAIGILSLLAAWRMWPDPSFKRTVNGLRPPPAA